MIYSFESGKSHRERRKGSKCFESRVNKKCHGSVFEIKLQFEFQTLNSNVKLILGYECSCRSGFKINPDDPSMCNDIDECSESYPCSQTCLNTPGSYKCSCLPGYLPLDQDPTRCKADSTEEFLILFTSR